MTLAMPMRHLRYSRPTGDGALGDSGGHLSPDGRAGDLGAHGGSEPGGDDTSGGHCDGCGCG